MSSISAASLEVRGVHVRLGDHGALVDASATFDRGTHTVIAGPNGAGKSTLLEVLAGVRSPDAGERRAPPRVIAYVPQRAAVPDRLPVTVRDVVAMGAWRRAGPWRRITGRQRGAIDAAMERLDIAALARRPFAELSGGQRQRTLLAQGLAVAADVLLLDEPTTGLDDAASRRIRDVLTEEAARGAAVICASHDPGILAEADRVLWMADGRISAPRPPRDPAPLRAE
jgi:zinc/manganese transport system ATP-binding protein